MLLLPVGRSWGLSTIPHTTPSSKGKTTTLHVPQGWCPAETKPLVALPQDYSHTNFSQLKMDTDEEASKSKKSGQKSSFYPICYYLGSSDSLYLNHIVGTLYRTSSVYGKCIKEAFTSGHSLTRYMKACRGLNESEEVKASSDHKELKKTSTGLKKSSSQKLQEDEPDSPSCLHCSGRNTKKEEETSSQEKL